MQSRDPSVWLEAKANWYGTGFVSAGLKSLLPVTGSG